MGFKVVLLSAFFIVSLVVPLSLVPVVKSGVDIIRVPSDFPTIQEAIDAASSGATILVSSGVYIENVNINKTLTLLGADKEDTVIDGSANSQGYSEAVGVTIAADNVRVNGFTVRNRWTATTGIRLDHSAGSVVSGNIITKGGKYGIMLFHSNNNTISDNIVSHTGTSPGANLNGEGIALSGSNNNTMQNNLITHSYSAGLSLLDSSANNRVLGNTIENNGFGFATVASGNNMIFHNNVLHFFGNPFVGMDSISQNNWSSDGKGNYWGDYTGLDDGSNGRIAGDGIGDTDLPWHGVDDYPLITPANPIRIFWDNKAFPTSLASNSTVSAFTFDHTNKKISFVATGAANTTGYFNASIPKTVLSGSWRIVLNQTDATSDSVIVENQTYTTIFLNYNHSSQNIELIGTHVIPEYPTASIFLLAILLLSLTAVIFVRRKPRTLRLCVQYS